MNQYSELQVALINARDNYEEQRSKFPDPKDRRIHKSQCDLISNHIRDLSEITRLESENEALRARVAELESGAGKLPYDVVVNGGITFRKGVDLRVFVKAAQRWHRQAMDKHKPVDAESFRQQADEAEKAGGGQ